MRKSIISSALCLLVAAACTKNPGLDSNSTGKTILKVSSETTKTTLSDAVDGIRTVFWSKGDAINVNGVSSAPLEIESSEATVEFTFVGELTPPYLAVYPASAYSDGVLTLPTTQKSVEGDNIASGQLPMVARSNEGNIHMQQVCGILGMSLKVEGESVKIRHIEITAAGGEQLCGKFNVDFDGIAITADGTGSSSLTLITQTDISTEASHFNAVIPAGNYSNGFTIKFVDELGRVMVKTLSGTRELIAGKLMALPELVFVPNAADEALEISTAAEWNSFVTAYNNKEYPGTQIVKITQDLDFSAVASDEYVPLGKKTTQAKFPAEENVYFEGTLLGGNHVIKNLDTDVPLIQVIGTNALVQDLSIDSTCDFSVWYDGTQQVEFGPLAAYCSAGIVKNCHASANITLSQYNNTANKAYMYVGGLIGRNRAAQIFDCSSASTITVDASYIVTTGTDKNHFYIGGFTGYCSNGLGLIEKCNNSGNISIAGTAINIYTGGICAKASAGTLKECTNSGKITFTTPRSTDDPCKFFIAGGIAGECSMNIIGCSNSGNILSESNVKQHMLGGIAGQITGANITLSDNTNSGNITTTAKLRNLYCGGLYGQIKAVQDKLILSGEPSTGSINIGETENSTASYLYCGGLIGQATKNLVVSGNATWTKSIDYTFTAANAAAQSFFGGIMGCAYGATVSLSGFTSAGAVTMNSAGVTLKHAVAAMGGILGGNIESRDSKTNEILSWAGATIENCSNNSTVRMTKSTSKANGSIMHIGGIAGLVRGGEVVIRNCSNSAKVSNLDYNNNTWTAYTGNFTGGIVGSVGYMASNTYDSVIENCTITGNCWVCAYRGGKGEIAGYASRTTISNCSIPEKTGDYEFGEFNTANYEYYGAPSGGIIGVAENCSINSCTVVRDIDSKDVGSCKAHAGGIVGQSVGTTIDGCKYYGDITITRVENSVATLGGIVGSADAETTIGTTTACSFGGSVEGTAVSGENLATLTDGSRAATIGSVTLWDGTL